MSVRQRNAKGRTRDERSPRAAVGIALHNGWAIAVSVTAQSDGPVVVDRRRLELADPELPSQPYHHEALELELREGEALVSEVRRAVSERARRALADLRSDLEIFDLAALALREPRPLPATLAEVLASRKALYIADSEIYRDAVHDAASELGIMVLSYAKAEEFEFAGQAVDSNANDVAKLVRSWRAALGPPWQKDHQAAAVAAMGALARLPAV